MIRGFQISVKGLDKDAYFINNPIDVEIGTSTPEVSKYVLLSILDEAGVELLKLKYYAYSQTIKVNLSSVIKDVMAKPKHPVLYVDGSDVGTNYRKLTLQFVEVGYSGNSIGTVVKTITFIRGGELSRRTNIEVKDGEVLKESELLPKWSGLPRTKYVYEGDKINIYSIIPEIELERIASECEGIYVRFLNSRGGYSYWLFEDWNIEGTTGDAIFLNNEASLGADVTYIIDVTGVVEQRYFSIMRALMMSPEVYIYEGYKKVFDITYVQGIDVDPWARVHNNGNNLSYNFKKKRESFIFRFDMVLKYGNRIAQQ